MTLDRQYMALWCNKHRKQGAAKARNFTRQTSLRRNNNIGRSKPQRTRDRTCAIMATTERQLCNRRSKNLRPLRRPAGASQEGRAYCVVCKHFRLEISLSPSTQDCTRGVSMKPGLTSYTPLYSYSASPIQRHSSSFNTSSSCSIW